MVLLQDTNFYIGGAVNHLGYRERRCKRVDGSVSTPVYLYDLQLQANTVSAQIKRRPKNNVYHIGGKHIRKKQKIYGFVLIVVDQGLGFTHGVKGVVCEGSWGTTLNG